MKKLILIFVILSVSLIGFITCHAKSGPTPSASSTSVSENSPSATTLPSRAQFFPSFADIIEPLVPAVVNIYTVKYNKKLERNQRSQLPEGFPFDQFNDFFEQFNMPFNFDEMYSDPKAVSLGSGFIIDSGGTVVTNHHVVKNADEIYVKLIDNTELPAELIGSDQRTDLALLKIKAKAPLPFVKFGDSAKARVGDWVIAIGNPFGLGGTVTTGIISSKGRDIDMSGGIVDDFIQTDAAINTGNSGGPMFNINGEVIGVNTAIFSPSGTNIGIGFAIPSDTTKNIIQQLEKTGKISRGRLDVTIQEVTTEIAEGLGLKEPVGALVVEVLPDGSGEKAGIKSGDVIIEFAGQPVKNSRKLQVLVAETPVNQVVKIVVVRNGKNQELSGKIIEIIDTDSKQKAKLLNNSQLNNAHIGQTIEKNETVFSNLTDDLRHKFGINKNINGVIVTSVSKNKKNYDIKVGDLVVAINQQYINNVAEFDKIYENAIASKKQNILLLIKRQNATIFIAFPLTMK